jgi:hypothetical protein
MRYYLILLRTPVNKKTRNNKCYHRCREMRSLILLVRMQISIAIMENGVEIPQKTKIKNYHTIQQFYY